MRREKEQIIKGKKFKITQLGFAEGLELLTTMGRIIGPVLKHAKSDINPAALMGQIISGLSYLEISNITEKMAKSTLIEREPGKWPKLEPELDLAGDYDLTLRWLKFALEVNYGGFFAAGGLLHGVINNDVEIQTPT